MTLLIDNYDSFTYNLFQYIEQLGEKCEVRRNDQITLKEIEALQPDRIVLSPGPGTPLEAGITLDVIRHFAGRVPILGVCLGHQAIGHAFGGRVVRAPKPRHGKLSKIKHDGEGVFTTVTSPLQVARYHSLAVEETSLPDTLEVTARSEDGVIMGLRHREFAIEGVQFHPESIATDEGLTMIENFLKGASRA